MNRGLEQGLIQGNTKGLQSGLVGGLEGMFTNNRLNILDPRSITDPKLKPCYWINPDDKNVDLIGTSVSAAKNLIDSKPGDLFPIIENVLTQTAGGSYRPPVLKNRLGGKSVFDFASDTSLYLISGQNTSPAFFATTGTGAASGTGFTLMFVIKRKQGGTYTIFDGRDNSTLPTPNDFLLEVNAAGRLTFDYRGGISGTVTSLIGTAGVNLLNDWSIVTVKAQLRKDGGYIPGDTDGGTFNKRFYKPIDGRIGDPLQIYVNGVEQQKIITTNTYTNADFYNDQTFRMFDRDFAIGNKASTYSTSGTEMATTLMIPAYIPYAMQQKLENYFRWYYSTSF
jgi:hypothetical protein